MIYDERIPPDITRNSFKLHSHKISCKPPDRGELRWRWSLGGLTLYCIKTGKEIRLPQCRGCKHFVTMWREGVTLWIECNYHRLEEKWKDEKYYVKGDKLVKEKEKK